MCVCVYIYCFPGGSVGKESACHVRDPGLIPGLAGEENGNPLQVSCLENSMDRGACQVVVHEVTESDTTEFYILYVFMQIWNLTKGLRRAERIQKDTNPLTPAWVVSSATVCKRNGKLTPPCNSSMLLEPHSVELSPSSTVCQHLYFNHITVPTWHTYTLKFLPLWLSSHYTLTMPSIIHILCHFLKGHIRLQT